VKVTTGDGEDNGTKSNVWIQMFGPKKRSTGKLFLQLAQSDYFAPGSVEIFSLEAAEMGEIKKIEVSFSFISYCFQGLKKREKKKLEKSLNL
jgi:hypothetical protein